MNEPMNRREFLRGAGRYVVAGGLTAGAAALALQKGRCDVQSPCAMCGKLGKCDLTKAIDYRRSVSAGAGRKEADHG